MHILLKIREGVKEKATKVACLGWRGGKVYVSSLGALPVLYVPLEMR